jgi:hypothetical protein
LESNKEKIEAQLIQQKIELNPGVTVAQLIEVEDQLDFKFSDSFKNFYLSYNGFKEDVMDQSFLYLWPIQKVLLNFDNENEFIGFCDFMVNSHSIGFLKTRQGIFKSYAQVKPICQTFDEFLFLWSNDDPELI